MSLGINTNLPGMSANRNLKNANSLLSKAFQRLSSGYKINQAKDGPAALVISELLRSQAGGIERGIRNTQEASNVLSIAEGGLSGISSQLTRMRELAVSSLNSGITSKSQISANQSELNSGISTIQQAASTTRFASRNLLDGSRDITFSADDPSQLLDIGATRIDEVSSIQGMEVAVNFSGDPAEQAEKAVLETDFGGTDTTLTQDQEFTVTGSEGSATFSFAAGTDMTEVADAINSRSDSTGVTAYSVNGDTELRLVSNDYGQQQSVQVQQRQGDAFATDGQTVRDYGQNAVLSIDGQRVEGDGLKFDVSSNNFSGTLVFNDDPGGIAQTGYDQDALTDTDPAQPKELTLGDISGGMSLQLGEGAGAQNREVFGIGSFDPSSLGRIEVDGQTYSLSDLRSGGSASLSKDPAIAIKVIDQAISDVASARGRIGAYQANTLETNANSLSVALENITATESGIRDANIAEEITQMVRAQILEKASMMGIQSANINAQNVLKLLGG